MEKGLTPQIIRAEMAKSPHGDYRQYLNVCLPAAKEDADFFGHLLSWNSLKNEIRDSKVAWPVIALVAKPTEPDIVENALAHMAAQDPRMFLRSLEFARTMGVSSKLMKRLARRYVRDRESNRQTLERSMAQYRRAMHELYRYYHIKPKVDLAKAILFGPGKQDDKADPRWQVPKGTIFDTIRNLSRMAVIEAASAVLRYNIPMLVAEGALGSKLKEPDVVLALIKRMSPTELVNRSKFLQRVGVRKDPVLRAAYEEALVKAGVSKVKKATLKATRAAEALEQASGDPEELQANAVLASKLRSLQERQIESISIEGDWLVLGDRSYSMQNAIERARQVAAVIARAAKGNVYLVFFNTEPEFFDVTGKTYEDIKKITSRVSANGNTSIGVGLDYALSRELNVDGIAIVSDGGENRGPRFAPTYEAYARKFDKKPTVYHWHLDGDPNELQKHCESAGIKIEHFEVPMSVDYYSMPSLVLQMRVNRYYVMDDIRATPFLSLDDVLTRTKERKVVRHEHAPALKGV